jgi:hypothetical protein
MCLKQFKQVHPKWLQQSLEEGEEFKFSPHRGEGRQDATVEEEMCRAQLQLNAGEPPEAADGRKLRGGPNPRSATAARARENRVDEWSGRPATST